MEVTKGLPGLHPREDVLDAGPAVLVRAVVPGLPSGELTARRHAVRADQAGPGVAAVGDKEPGSPLRRHG